MTSFLKRIEIFKNLGFELEELNEIHEKKDMKRLFGILIKKENFTEVSFLINYMLLQILIELFC